MNKPQKVELYFIIWQLSLQKPESGNIKLSHPSMQLVQFSCQTEIIISLGKSNTFFFSLLDFHIKKKKKVKMLFSFCDFW